MKKRVKSYKRLKKSAFSPRDSSLSRKTKTLNFNLAGLKAGQMLEGKKYQVKREIGRGGMGIVYLAHDKTLDRLVAIKVLPALYTNDNSLVNSFRREARAVARLEHSNIVPIYSVNLEQGINYFIMQYIKGITLKKLIKNKGRYSLQEAMPLIEQITSGLAFAHDRGIIHRDIKPDNIMVSANDHVTLMDFGLCKVLEGNTSSLTNTVRGTLKYISPEQAQGKKGDRRSDIYSLGILLYEML
jgi:eukaryotic-like serine/threonine-protein kinase